MQRESPIKSGSLNIFKYSNKASCSLSQPHEREGALIWFVSMQHISLIIDFAGLSINVCAMACINELVIWPSCCWCHTRLSDWFFCECFQILDLFVCNCHIDSSVINFLFHLFLSKFWFDTLYKSINVFGSFNTFLAFSVLKKRKVFDHPFAHPQAVFMDRFYLKIFMGYITK